MCFRWCKDTYFPCKKIHLEEKIWVNLVENSVLQGVGSINKSILGKVTKKCLNSLVCVNYINDSFAFAFPLCFLKSCTFFLFHFRKSLGKWLNYT